MQESRKEEMLSVPEVAERLLVSTRTITRWINDGEFPNAFKKRPGFASSPFVIPLSDVIAFEERRDAAAKSNR